MISLTCSPFLTRRAPGLNSYFLSVIWISCFPRIGIATSLATWVIVLADAADKNVSPTNIVVILFTLNSFARTRLPSPVITNGSIFYSRPHGSALSLSTLQCWGMVSQQIAAATALQFVRIASTWREYREYFPRPSVLNNKGTTQPRGMPHAR